jgi:hypothetical protein
MIISTSIKGEKMNGNGGFMNLLYTGGGSGGLPFVTLDKAGGGDSGPEGSPEPDSGKQREPGGKFRVGPKLPGPFKGRNEFELWKGEPDMEFEIKPTPPKDFFKNPGKGWGGEFKFKYRF